MRRGDIFDARLNPTEGSEQAGVQPVVIVSRDAINKSCRNAVKSYQLLQDLLSGTPYVPARLVPRGKRTTGDATIAFDRVAKEAIPKAIKISSVASK